MSKKLNDKQRKLAEENHNLIYSFLKSRQLSLDAVEDWYGTAAIGLCKAALVYDENRGAKFATLAYICMENEVRCVMRISKKTITGELSLDYEYEQDDSVVPFIDMVADENDFYYPIYLNDAIAIASNKLSERDRKVIDMIVFDDMKISDIAKTHGIGRACVYNIYSKFIKDVRECLTA